MVAPPQQQMFPYTQPMYRPPVIFQQARVIPRFVTNTLDDLEQHNGVSVTTSPLFDDALTPPHTPQTPD
eukprot:CAMPEP_0118953648 /NCGR_PEP_ID=MMETSP1169-20130426/56935_1 /TAXON_ID=36882 /ORGANISM="Pyramimonas obovata, Strain CCMP722" /LENGTH=68 /DNA_ID=CAMNT_0006901159 /DNA_START=707 /DNA_END=910 /DNA_ORIENTATION=+